MERPYSSYTIEQLVEIIENSFIAVVNDFGHVNEGYCLACDDEPFKALEEIKERCGWSDQTQEVK